MSERSELIAWIRGEIIGPAQSLKDPAVIAFVGRDFVDPEQRRSGPMAWRPTANSSLEEVLYFQRETPHRKYGAGLLHPAGAAPDAPDEAALQSGDTIGAEADAKEETAQTEAGADEDDDAEVSEGASVDGGAGLQDDFEVTSPDARHPSSLGLSFCARLAPQGRVAVRLPLKRKFSWQFAEAPAVSLNGRYELCTHRTTDGDSGTREAPIWRRVPAVLPDCEVLVDRADLLSGSVVRRDLTMPTGSPISLRIEIFPRRLRGELDIFLLTVVLRNSTIFEGSREPREQILYQTHFDVEILDGELVRYPESERPFSKLDAEEQSLALLYRESATWAIGHGCAAGWESDLGTTPKTIFADVMPSVQLPSMTPDIEVDGEPVKLSMRSLANLTEEGVGEGWQSLDKIVLGYGDWIKRKRQEATGLDGALALVAARHLDACDQCLTRITDGVTLLRGNARVRRAFRLANLAMLLQQIGTKQVSRRPLTWDVKDRRVLPSGEYQSPSEIYEGNLENRDRVGSWRAFQIAFLLMSLHGVRDGQSSDRNIVDLIWFPTGGGKTEAYLGVMAFYMFHERLLMESDTGPRRDGTNVLMRYTLRMLTTQQFQRAASLICSMEYLRRNPSKHLDGSIPGHRFSLGLWIGSDGSPNKVRDAKVALRRFRNGDTEGNPLVLTECPWCRAEIGRYNGGKPRGLTDSQWAAVRTCGIQERLNEPLLLCSDGKCEFGQENPDTWLPVEVIDERIYQNPPSIIISTADKLAIIAYRPEASALFGNRIIDSQSRRVSMPPGLIIQDELHLISGPLGTMYALYEGVIEKLCSAELNGTTVKPKVIASTATIRGAADQVRALYARTETHLFPTPGLSMGDSFFGKYARDERGNLRSGRLYLGIHANDYGSVLTTQVRTFSSALSRPWSFAPSCRDAWWTLLAFYNSIRELGGARTLFDSDIRSRLKFVFNREGFAQNDRRQLKIIEELTSRLSQAEIVSMMDRLSMQYDESSVRGNLDACLASNIIEVGVDIDRLSLMGVVGQPKSTASYIQVTGRVGRRWWDRAGLVLMIYNPSKSRDRSHYEQFHSYHRRLYERVEPNTTTPFATSAIQRGLPGVLLAWARQQSSAPVFNYQAYAAAVETAYQLLCDRCLIIQPPEDQVQSLASLKRVRDELISKWGLNPQEWEKFPQRVDGEYLMLWPGQFATKQQERRGVVVPSSMRQVERSAELTISQGYDTAL
ncbi:helicase-related protein [Bradyrhizobium sp. BR 1433]|uniref:helicase-related protein n=1 Tax=Bradyrhizobium sp. BR 1433 TaxID=3447967 RepID=UPI003EE5B6D9